MVLKRDDCPRQISYTQEVWELDNHPKQHSWDLVDARICKVSKFTFMPPKVGNPP